jgi:hypothetical protein
MKQRSLIGFVVILIGFAVWISRVSSVSAQSFGAIGSGPIAPTVAQCPPSPSNQAYLCAVGSGTSYQWYTSFAGGAYVALAVAGPQGPTGATGAQGPAGPALTACPNAVLSGSGTNAGLIFGSGCH